MPTRVDSGKIMRFRRKVGDRERELAWSELVNICIQIDMSDGSHRRQSLTWGVNIDRVNSPYLSYDSIQ